MDWEIVMVASMSTFRAVVSVGAGLILLGASTTAVKASSCHYSMGWGVADEAAFRFLPSEFFQQLPSLVFECNDSIDVIETVERLSRGSDSVWWESYLGHLQFAEIRPVEGHDQQYLKSLAPEDPALGGLYALVMQRVTDAPAFWKAELSRIVSEHPDVVGQIRSGDAPLHLDMAVLSDWIVEQDPAYLDLFVERVAWEHWIELAELVEPEQLSPMSFSMLLGRHYKAGIEPPEGWLSYFERHLGDWMLLLLPQELRDAEVWDLEHRRMLRIRNPMQNAIGEALESMGPLMAVSFFPDLLEHDSPIVRRVATILRLELIPSVAHFEHAVAAGVTPALLAAEADWDLVQALMRVGLQSEASSNLVSFVENLDCYSYQRISELGQVPDSGEGSIATALRNGIETCRE